MRKMKFTALNFKVSENMVQPIENIGGLKNQPAKNGAQVIENKAHLNFQVSENINQPKFEFVKTDIRSETCVEFFC